MDKIIIIRYAEIYLKGKNRGFFERSLAANIKRKLEGIRYKFTMERSRYIVSDFEVQDMSGIIKRLGHIFGIHSVSVAYICASDMERICETALFLSRNTGKFRVNTNRADKSYPMNSMQVSARVGGYLLSERPGLSVDLHAPDFQIYIDIRENGKTFIFSDIIACAGGMPVGTAGKGLVMLSGGIDSPVAAYMMAKRGLSLAAVHFHSYPYTSENAKQKVVDLASILKEYCIEIKLFCIPFTKIQESINKNCPSEYMITIMRRAMMRISEAVAKKENLSCLVNGESLGQVASQTLESINVTNSVVESLPVFRPLIGFDKQEIIDISKKIGTFETSVLPYEDCCTVFLPEHPVTKPKLERVVFEEAKIANYDLLIKEAIDNCEIIKL